MDAAHASAVVDAVVLADEPPSKSPKAVVFLQPFAADRFTVGGKNVPRRSEYEADEQLLSMKELAERYKTTIHSSPEKSSGLSKEEAAARLVLYGHNVLTPPKETPEILKFLYGEPRDITWPRVRGAAGWSPLACPSLARLTRWQPCS